MSSQLESLNAAMPFAVKVGMRFVKAEKNEVVGEVMVTPDNCTAGHIGHGGFIMTIADCAAAIGAVLNLPDGCKTTTTTEAKTNLIGAAPEGSVLRVTANPVSTGRRLQVWQVKVETADGKLVSLTTQTQMNL